MTRTMKEIDEEISRLAQEKQTLLKAEQNYDEAKRWFEHFVKKWPEEAEVYIAASFRLKTPPTKKPTGPLELNQVTVPKILRNMCGVSKPTPLTAKGLEGGAKSSSVYGHYFKNGEIGKLIDFVQEHYIEPRQLSLPHNVSLKQGKDGWKVVLVPNSIPGWDEQERVLTQFLRRSLLPRSLREVGDHLAEVFPEWVGNIAGNNGYVLAVSLYKAAKEDKLSRIIATVTSSNRKALQYVT